MIRPGKDICPFEKALKKQDLFKQLLRYSVLLNIVRDEHWNNMVAGDAAWRSDIKQMIILSAVVRCVNIR